MEIGKSATRNNHQRNTRSVHWFSGEFSNQQMRVPVAADRSPVIEVEGELAIPTNHEVGFQPRPCQTVVATGSSILTEW